MKNLNIRINGSLSRSERKALLRKVRQQVEKIKDELKAKIKAVILTTVHSSSGTVIQGKLGFNKDTKDSDFLADAKAIYNAFIENDRYGPFIGKLKLAYTFFIGRAPGHLLKNGFSWHM